MVVLLQKWDGSDRQLVGCFSAASNITGKMADVNAITITLHKHGAFAFWDYATAGPYVHVDVNPVVNRLMFPCCTQLQKMSFH